MKIVQVLLVEDNAGDAVLAGQALADCPIPVKLTVARDGEQALSILSDHDYKPDLIILDLNIPKIPGHVLLQRYPAKKTPIVVFSAYWNDLDLDRAFALGVREYVQKPSDLDVFKAAVCGMVQKWAVHPTGAAGESAIS
jgi:two-component system, chemotaxis family, response regulator Rcp1